MGDFSSHRDSKSGHRQRKACQAKPLATLHSNTQHNTTYQSRLSQFWHHLHHKPFPLLRGEVHLASRPELEKLTRVLEFPPVERCVPSSCGCVRRPLWDSRWPKREPSSPRRYWTCPPPRRNRMPQCGTGDAADLRFRAASRAPRHLPLIARLAELAALKLPARDHEPLIRVQFGDQIIGHIVRD